VAGTISAEATFTQQATASHRRLWAVLLVLLGVIALVSGALVWASDRDLENVDGAVRQLVSDAMNNDMPSATNIVAASAAALMALIALSALLMLLGLTGAGRLVRISAIFSALCGVGVMAAAPLAAAVDHDTGIDFVAAGLALVVGGAVIAFVGGVLLKR
jgi:hypothetical protein